MREFDRMIPASERESNFVKAGVERERERIIKLLEESLNYDYWEGIYYKTDGIGVSVQDLIALIKGEQK